MAIAAAVGVAVFSLAYLALASVWAPGSTQIAQRAGAPDARAIEATSPPDGIAQQIAPGRVAVGVPASASQALLAEVRAGDRLDVLALVPETPGGQPVAGIIARGAAVLRPAAAGPAGTMLLEVSPDEAMALAHLLQSGARLSYALWAAEGVPATAEPLNRRSALGQLGLPLPTSPARTPTPATVAKPALIPTAVPPAASAAPATVAPTPLPDRYRVQSGDTLVDIAVRLGVDYGALWWANRHLPDPSFLMPGTELLVPRFRGFLYIAAEADTWEALGRRFGLPAERLKQINELPPESELRVGAKLFVPYGP